MSLDKFKSIIQEKGRFVPENELEIFQQYDLRTSFGSFQHDTIRVMIYDASNNPLPQAEFGYVRYINKTNQPQYYKRIDGPTKRSRRNYTIDVKKLIKDAGYNIGIFTVEMMFVNNRLGTQTKPNRVWIQQISPSRTEVRVLPFDVGDFKLNNLSLQEIIDERYTAFLYDEEFKEDIYEAIEPFLDLITTDDIRNLMTNRVGEKIFKQILLQYFKNDSNEFDRIVNELMIAFKDAVRYELADRDSLIGPSYNIKNPNFGNERPTTRVSIDFPTFCFNKLLESLEVYIPKLKDFEVTEFDEETEEFPFPRVRPKIFIPEVRDPNPTTTPPTTQSPGTPPPPPPTTTLPPIKYDRGQGKFKVSLYTNQPKNLLYLSENKAFNGGTGPFTAPLFTGETSVISTFFVKEYDSVIQKYVPNDLNWIEQSFDTTTEEGWNAYNKYLPEQTKQLVKEFNFTDSERGYTPIALNEPILPIPNTNIDCCPGWPDNNVIPQRYENVSKAVGYPSLNSQPNNNYPIPFYYYNKNDGTEKDIQIFKDNQLEISINNTNFDVVCSNMIVSYNSFYSGDLQPFGGQRVETEHWVFDGYYNWDTGEKISNLPDLKLKITKDINIFIKYKRTTIPIRGIWVKFGKSPTGNEVNIREYVYATGLIQKDASGVWQSNGGMLGVTKPNRNFEGLPQTIGDPEGEPSPIMFGLQNTNFKHIDWSPNYESWTGRPEWQNLAKITDPTKGGVYQQPLLDSVKDFLKDKETFSRFEF